MNIFKAFKHVSGRKPRPEPAVLMDGDVILRPGEEVHSLHYLVSGAVLAYGLDNPNGRACQRTRMYRRLEKQESPPIFGAENYFYCRPSELTYRAIGRVELCRIGSDMVVDLGQKASITYLVRELIRDSDLSPKLLLRLDAKHKETGLPGFKTENPREILTIGEEAHGLIYDQFAQELLVELFMERRNRSSILTTKMVSLDRNLLPA